MKRELAALLGSATFGVALLGCHGNDDYHEDYGFYHDGRYDDRGVYYDDDNYRRYDKDRDRNHYGDHHDQPWGQPDRPHDWGDGYHDWDHRR